MGGGGGGMLILFAHVAYVTKCQVSDDRGAKQRGGWGGRNPPEFWIGGGVEHPDFEKIFIRGGWLPLN